KRIPLVSGLGGDSSDAAATLRGLNQLWGLGLSQEDLSGLARRLGSDVPFFLYGGTALAEGRGERLTPLPSPQPVWVVLLVPPVPRPPGKTQQLYSRLTPAHFSGGEVTRRLVARLKRSPVIETSLLFNVFDAVADGFFAGLSQYRQRFLAAGAGTVHLAGSGPTLFTLTGEEAEAKSVFQRLQEQNLESYLEKTG
ncbi:MAG: 4-diphosphocytidyl-2C-methyl-D-erythritol kinase, partial [Chloroflexota bacterium]